PSQLSATSHDPVAGRQTAVLFWSGGQSLLAPSQLSARSQAPAAGRHTAELLASAGQLGPVPGQLSAGSHAPCEARHTVEAGWKASGGQAAPVPSQVSAASHAPAAGRHTAPPFPARCWQASFVPSQVSVVQRLPSSVHGVPAGTFPSAGHAGPVPVQVSAASHSPAEARHTVKLDRKASGGQALLVPSHVSSTSHGPAIGRQTAPAFPAGCWQASSVPSQVSVVHALPSSVHGVPPGDLSSGGQLGPVPVQFSAGSHSPAEGRQTTVEGWKASAGQVVLVPSQVSSWSHGPAAARHTAPASAAGRWRASCVPSQVSVVHALPSSVQAEPAALLASGGHACPGSPPQPSATSHSPAAGRQMTPMGRKTSAGQVESSPSQTSSGSHTSLEP